MYFPLYRAEEVYDQTVHAQSNISIFEGSATLLPTHISFNKPLSPPHHAPQRRCISHHKAPKENGKASPYFFSVINIPTEHYEMNVANGAYSGLVDGASNYFWMQDPWLNTRSFSCKTTAATNIQVVLVRTKFRFCVVFFFVSGFLYIFMNAVSKMISRLICQTTKNEAIYILSFDFTLAIFLIRDWMFLFVTQENPVIKQSMAKATIRST